MCCDEVIELKWTIQQLIKKAKNDNFIEEKLDLRNYLSDKQEDLTDILDTEVVGQYHYYHDDDTFVFDLHIKTTLIMICSLTLNEVPVKLDFNSQLKFSVNYIDDDTHVIEGITIDLVPYIFSEILVEKPMKVIAKGAEKSFKEETVELDQIEIDELNPFANLKK